jgi:hypothetical protein
LCAVGGQPHAPRPARNPAPETRPPGRSNGPGPQVSRERANPSRTDSSRDGEGNRSGSGGHQRPRATRATSSSKEGAIR